MAPDRLPDAFLEFVPELIVEVIFPTDRWQEKRQKIGEYFAIGVQHVWVVELEHRSIVVYRSAIEMHTLVESNMLTLPDCPLVA